MRLAIFDFDGTIYRKETFHLFMEHLKQYSKRYRKFYSTILPVFIGYKLKLIPEIKMKSKVMYHYARALDGFSEEELETFFSDVYKSMEEDFNSEVIEKITLHRDNDLKLFIVSGAFTPLLQIVADNYNINYIIGTEIPDINEEIDHIHAERKVSRLMELLDGNEVDWQESYAYGDSIQDMAVLDLVGNPVAVAPDEELTNIAVSRGWEIIK